MDLSKSSSSPVSATTILGQIQSAFKDVTGDSVDADTSLASLYIDDFNLCEIINKIEECLGVSIPDDTALSFKTVGQIVDFLSESGE